MKNGRKAPRSRTGCKRCKERRFKCDEAQPTCGRCQAAGLPCPGYNKSLKWSTKHEIFPSSKKPPSHLRSPIAGPGQLVDDHSNDNGDQLIADPGDPNTTSLVGDLTATPESVGLDHLTQFELPLSLEKKAEAQQIERSTAGISPFDPCLDTLTGLSYPSAAFYYDPASFDLITEIDETEPSTLFVAAPTPIQEDVDVGSQQLVHRQSFFPPPARGPSDFSSALVEYYFKETAGVFSCYDSSMNPFRTTVGNFWTLSPALHRTLQSMAAACLVNESPYFKRICRKLRSEALSLLFHEPDQDDKTLLALLMLGQSSSWFDPQDLGIPLFKALKAKLNTRESNVQNQLQVVSDNAFFQEALEYWEMLLSFVSSDVSADTMDGPFSSPYPHARKVPHPWTGICRETQMLVNQVGQLVRTERIRARSAGFPWQSFGEESFKPLQFARYLESRLRSLSEPQDEEIVSPGDTQTPVWHLQRIAEIYRRTGLINLYRVFPDLLLHHVGQAGTTGSNTSGFQLNVTDGDNWLGLIEGSQHDDHRGEGMYQWLTNFAIETIELLESIPVTSRTRCLQPFMLVVCASELRAPSMEDEILADAAGFGQTPDLGSDELFESHITATRFTPDVPGEDSSFLPANTDLCDDFSLTQAFRVFHARKFVRGRLNLFMNVLPPRPTKTCLDLVEAVWNRLDDGDEDAYWIDIMMEKGLHTTMG